MGLNFKEYKLLNIEDLIVNEKDKDKDKYKLKKLYRKNKEVQIFSKRAFNKYTDEHEVQIVGRIRKRQHHYTDYADYNDLVKEKKKKKIIGSTKLTIDDNKTEPDFKKYDVKKDKNRFTYGYAWIGENKFIRVTRFNLLLLLIPLLIILGILLGLYLCPNDNINLPFADGSVITDEQDNGTVEQPPLCYFEPFDERTVLTSDNRIIQLKNVPENTGNYYINYEIYINGELQHLTIEDDTYYLSDTGSQTFTGLIQPGKSVKVNCYNGLDAGTYDLTCKATEYDYNTKEEKLLTYDLKTILVIEK